MDVENLKYVVGKAEEGKPAIIRFFSAVDENSVRWFNDEFLWLQDFVKPSKIIVMINSEGGSVLYGMSTFSVIRSCPIEVDCVIEGIAASMASIIWAAGDNLYMHDYSLLMIHNPFNSNVEDEDPSVKQTVEAFRSQLETIYTKRFGLSKDKVAEIMNGEGDADGTFFSAKDAVKAGFIPSENVIKTSKKVRDKVKNEIVGIDNAADMRNIMSAVSAEVDENKLIEVISTIRNQKDNYLPIQDNKKMENNEKNNFDAISAQLGLAKDTQAAAIEARIAELINAEAALKETQSELTATKIKLEGKEAELANVNSELAETKASLQAYKDAEQAALAAEIEAVVDDAIKAGKIEASAKDAWTKMAESDFATVKSTLASIQAREVITEEIAGDPANVGKIEETLKDVDAQMKAKIKENLGDVEFEKF
jgi:ATP-dependent protease ClpP protease subunit